MATYLYETTDKKPPLQFEVRQSMSEPALTRDPATGRPVRRVISGGFGIMSSGGSQGSRESTAPPSSSCCGGGGCGCH